MGTRGVLGFVIDGELKVGYNHYDSYPKGLGVDVLTWLRNVMAPELAPVGEKVLREAVRGLRVVTQDVPPTEDEIARLSHYHDNVGTGAYTDWYALLRKTQGDPAAILSVGCVEDASEFPYNSLFCEWGYIVDLDNRVLEVYRGFQKSPHNAGRFADGPPNETLADLGTTYYPIKRVAEFGFDALPTPEVFARIVRRKCSRGSWKGAGDE